MGAHESMEHAEHAEHASGSNKKIALLIAVIALFLALSETLGKGAQTEAISKNVEASNLWAFFQAKSIRRTVVQATSEHAKLSLGPIGDDAAKAALQKQIDDWKKTAARYRSEPETGEGSEELAKRAKQAEHQRDDATAKYHHYEIASAVFQIGIVLASATIITGMIVLAWVFRPAGSRRHRHHRARPLLAASAALLALRLIEGRATPHLAVMPRSSGASSTPRLLGSSTDVSGILDRPLEAAMTLCRSMATAPRARSCESAGSAAASAPTSRRHRRRRISRMRCLIGATSAFALARIIRMKS